MRKIKSVDVARGNHGIFGQRINIHNINVLSKPKSSYRGVFVSKTGKNNFKKTI